MRVLAIALLSLVLNCLYWVQFRGFEILQDYVTLRDYDISKDLALLVLSALLTVEGILLVRRDRKRHDDDLRRESEEKQILETELSEIHTLQQEGDSLRRELQEAKEELSQVTVSLKEMSEGRAQLKVAYDEAKTRLEAQLAQAKQQGSAEEVHSAVIHFLSLLQQRGRFIDFVMDDISTYDDAQVGAASRVVQQGCAAVLREHFTIAPIHAGAEGEPIVLEKEYHPDRYRLVGKVLGGPPFKGVVLHRGWKTREMTLPTRVHGAGDLGDRDVIAPAEVEVN